MCALTSAKNLKYSIIIFPPLQHPVQVGLVDVGTTHPAPEEYGSVFEIVKQIVDVLLLAVATAVGKPGALFLRGQFVPDQDLAALEQAQVIDRPDGDLAGEELHPLFLA
jgi:hypothetical protein